MNLRIAVIALWLWVVIAGKNTYDTCEAVRCSRHPFDISHIKGFKVLSIDSNFNPRYAEACVCAVTINITHVNAYDNVFMQFDLPAKDDWKGRFVGMGGGNFAVGRFDHDYSPLIGWAVGSTDGGHFNEDHTDISWALYENRTVNWNLLDNFAHRSLVDLINIGKSITRQYYGGGPNHTYWAGCSNGGRQGYIIAQRSPGLVDRILANAPAIGIERLVMLGFWPQLLMQKGNVFPLNCELDFAKTKAIEHCDRLDHVCDGLLEDPQQCNFDPLTLVGQQVPNCMSDGPVIFSKDVAQLIAEFHKGIQWGLEPDMTARAAWGTNMTELANIRISNGSRSIAPHPPTASWVKNIMFRDPNYNLSRVSENEFWERYHKTLIEFGSLLHSDNPDLSSLRNSNTKMLTFHGLEDAQVPYENTLEYRNRVERIMGGADEVNEYYRLFLGPGVLHCSGGSGPEPSRETYMAALVAWVEKGIPPKTLPAERKCIPSLDNRTGTTRCPDGRLTRNLCLWPAKQMYRGGDPGRASSWTCVDSAKGSHMAIKRTQPALAQVLVADLMTGSAEPM